LFNSTDVPRIGSKTVREGVSYHTQETDGSDHHVSKLDTEKQQLFHTRMIGCAEASEQISKTNFTNDANTQIADNILLHLVDSHIDSHRISSSMAHDPSTTSPSPDAAAAHAGAGAAGAGAAVSLQEHDKIAIIDYLANFDHVPIRPIHTQLSIESLPVPEQLSERRRVLCAQLTRDCGVFLECYGSFLTDSMLAKFDSLTDVYEVAYHLQALRASRHIHNGVSQCTADGDLEDLSTQLKAVLQSDAVNMSNDNGTFIPDGDQVKQLRKLVHHQYRARHEHMIHDTEKAKRHHEYVQHRNRRYEHVQQRLAAAEFGDNGSDDSDILNADADRDPDMFDETLGKLMSAAEWRQYESKKNASPIAASDVKDDQSGTQASLTGPGGIKLSELVLRKYDAEERARKRQNGRLASSSPTASVVAHQQYHGSTTRSVHAGTTAYSPSIAPQSAQRSDHLWGAASIIDTSVSAPAAGQMNRPPNASFKHRTRNSKKHGQRKCITFKLGHASASSSVQVDAKMAATTMSLSSDVTMQPSSASISTPTPDPPTREELLQQAEHRYRYAIQSQFVDGELEDFDYNKIDRRTHLDFSADRERDLEEAWFDAD
jgi:Coiled-coil domain containing protein 97-like, C-terminal